MSNEQRKKRAEPVYRFSAELFFGPNPQGEKVYTIQQATDATGLSKKLIRQEIEAGAISVVDLPGQRRTMIRRQDLNGYIRTRARGGWRTMRKAVTGRTASFFGVSESAFRFRKVQ